MDERWREVVGKQVECSVAKGTQTLVFLNNGNILNSAEMDPETILEHVPRLVANSPCNALEIEVGVESLLEPQVQAKLHMIQKNLLGKQLRVRVAVEYADDRLLSQNRKGTTMKNVDGAITALSSAAIPWVGYALLGGAEMTSEEAKHAAIQTGKYIMDLGARMLSINGIFVTDTMKEAQEKTGRRMYLPSMEDLLGVLKTLSDYRSFEAYDTLIKVGLEEEDEALRIVEYPYGLSSDEPMAKKKLTGILSDFNRSQSFDVFLVAGIQNVTRVGVSQRL
jgi:hypothetical protein